MGLSLGFEGQKQAQRGEDLALARGFWVVGMVVMEEAVGVEGRAYVEKHCCDLELLQKVKSIWKPHQTMYLRVAQNVSLKQGVQ